MDYKEICLRDKIGEFLCEFAQSDDRIYVIDSDLAKSTKTLNFKDKYPKRFIEAGIAEASAVSIADGIAAEGGIPFYVNFATFVTGTAWTQVRQSAYANSNVKLIGTYVGMDNGPDGASHHANEDIALMRMIPNMKILIPSSVKELKQSIQIAIEYNGPVYIRVTRDVVPDVELEKDAKMGKAIVVQDDGNDFALIYEGTTTSLAYKSFEILKEKGYKLAICSNASKWELDVILRKLEVNDYFDVIQGVTEKNNKKYSLEELLLREKPELAVMVGDRSYDKEAARYNQIPFVGCKYGYGKPEELSDCKYSVETALELSGIIDEIISARGDKYE